MNTQQVGLLVDNLESSQLSYEIIKELNACSDNIILFAENTHVCCLQNNFAVMSLHEMCGFTGTLISTDFKTASKALLQPAKRKIFFVWDLEFIRGINNYDMYSKVYLNNNMELCVRSEEHAKLIDNCFNKKARVVGNTFCLERILNE